jgi:phosphate uptake regulator
VLQGLWVVVVVAAAVAVAVVVVHDDDDDVARLFSVLYEQLIEALRYRPERRGFDFRWGYWDFY